MNPLPACLAPTMQDNHAEQQRFPRHRIDPVQQLNAPEGPLADIARELGERLARVATNLDA